MDRYINYTNVLINSFPRIMLFKNAMANNILRGLFSWMNCRESLYIFFLSTFPSSISKNSRIRNYRMKFLGLFLLLLSVNSPSSISAQTPVALWQQCSGGTKSDAGNCIIKTGDGNYLVAGKTESVDGPVVGNHGGYDAWIVKYDSSGTILWQKCFGGSGDDEALSLIACRNGGYAFSGYTESYDGDVVGNHLSSDNFRDVWVVKLDNNGIIEWQKCLGGTASEESHSILQSDDGSFVISGFTQSIDGDVVGNHAVVNNNIWVIRISENGSGILQQKCYGGNLNDEAYAAIQTSDSGYLIAGSTNSNDGDISFNHGNNDFWILKLNPDLTLSWQKTYGGSDNDKATTLVECLDGNYIVGGSASSSDGDVTGHHGTNSSEDFWLVKINPADSILWQHCYGGNNSDILNAVCKLPDGSFVLAGSSNSIGGDVSTQLGNADGWICLIDETGNLRGELSLGSSNSEVFNSVVDDLNNQVIAVGDGGSQLPLFNGGKDEYLVKLRARVVGIDETEIQSSFVKIFPNPATNKLKIESLNGFGILSDEISFTLLDAGGRILRRIVLPESRSWQIDCSDIAAGFYLYSIGSVVHGFQSGHLIIQR